MSEKELIKQLKKLPSEAQQEAADFVEFLAKKYTQQSEASSPSKNQSIKEEVYSGKLIQGNVERSRRYARQYEMGSGTSEKSMG